MSQLHPCQHLQFGLLAASLDMAPKTSAAAKAKEEPQAQVRKVAKVHGKGKGKGRGKSAKSREERSDYVEVSKDFYKRATEELSFQTQTGCFTGASEVMDARCAPGRREAVLTAFAESRRPSAPTCLSSRQATRWSWLRSGVANGLAVGKLRPSRGAQNISIGLSLARRRMRS